MVSALSSAPSTLDGTSATENEDRASTETSPLCRSYTTLYGVPDWPALASVSPMPTQTSTYTWLGSRVIGLLENAMKDRSPATICWIRMPMAASSCFMPAARRLSAARFVHKLCHTRLTAVLSAAWFLTATLAMESYRPAPEIFCRSSQLALDRTITRTSPANASWMLAVTAGGICHLSAMNFRILLARASAASPLVAAASNSLASCWYSGMEAWALASIAPNGRTHPGGAWKSAWWPAAMVKISAAAAALAPHKASEASRLAMTLVLDASMLDDSVTVSVACLALAAGAPVEGLTETCPLAETSSSTWLPMLDAMPLRSP
mmetsp:Transcript_11312/g.21917  ORF Transcript_11312/g.21917 Transcript_11312/m.21917 type:complete len:321 (-) Transcript_11312:1583-2545(-)